MHHPPDRFVDLRQLLPRVDFDIRYATENNFTGATLPGYGMPGAWLAAPVAESFAEIVGQFEKAGFGVRLFDAYRPVRASVAMVNWAKSSGNQWMIIDGYIAATSQHNRGCAVDLTLLSEGKPLDMGTTWDTFSKASHSANAVGDVLANRQVLREPMIAAGWKPARTEWWHFSLPVEGLTALDVPYEQEINR